MTSDRYDAAEVGIGRGGSYPPAWVEAVKEEGPLHSGRRIKILQLAPALIVFRFGTTILRRTFADSSFAASGSSLL